MKEVSSEVCCPKFSPEPWDEKELIWNNKPFVKRKVATFFYMPVNFGLVMKDLSKKITEAGAQVSDNLCLSRHTTKWKMDIYLAVAKEVSNEENRLMSGKYYSKVYEGRFNETGKWMDDYKEYVKNKGMEIDDMYMWYTTCPKCAKKYGKNYVVIIGKVK